MERQTKFIYDDRLQFFEIWKDSRPIAVQIITFSNIENCVEDLIEYDCDTTINIPKRT